MAAPPVVCPMPLTTDGSSTLCWTSNNNPDPDHLETLEQRTQPQSTGLLSGSQSQPLWHPWVMKTWRTCERIVFAQSTSTLQIHRQLGLDDKRQFVWIKIGFLKISTMSYKLRFRTMSALRTTTGLWQTRGRASSPTHRALRRCVAESRSALPPHSTC